MYQVYAEKRTGTIEKVGKPLPTKLLAHDFCKDCWAILNTKVIADIFFEEVGNESDRVKNKS